MPEVSLQIKNKVGLHARPASLFVQEANKYKSTILVTKDDTTANAKSILNVLTLGANHGAVVTIKAEGDDADQALAAIAALFENNFGEKE